jgi:hypothetical protein
MVKTFLKKVFEIPHHPQKLSYPSQPSQQNFTKPARGIGVGLGPPFRVPTPCPTASGVDFRKMSKNWVFLKNPEKLKKIDFFDFGPR